jgi:predicted nucleotidyltransferase
MTDFRALLTALTDAGVEFLIVGGAARLTAEITGGGGYQELLPDTLVLSPFGIECRCLGLKRLIEVKRAAGRPKDFEAIAELEAIVEERGE